MVEHPLDPAGGYAQIGKTIGASPSAQRRPIESTTSLECSTVGRHHLSVFPPPHQSEHRSCLFSYVTNLPVRCSDVAADRGDGTSTGVCRQSSSWCAEAGNAREHHRPSRLREPNDEIVEQPQRSAGGHAQISSAIGA